MHKNILILITLLVFISGCGVLKPYQADIQQGNLIDQNEIKQLQIGMTKDEVKAAIGTPLLNNAFANNQWNYVYTNQVNGGKIEKKSLLLVFENNKLTEIKLF